MISVSWSASFFRIANMSSCLRKTLAFSTSSDSAKAIRSVGLLFLSSWSFISCMSPLWVHELRGMTAAEEFCWMRKRAASALRREPLFTLHPSSAQDGSPASERLDDIYDHDPDHQDRNSLIDNAPMPRRTYIPIYSQLAHGPGKITM